MYYDNRSTEEKSRSYEKESVAATGIDPSEIKYHCHGAELINLPPYEPESK